MPVKAITNILKKNNTGFVKKLIVGALQIKSRSILKRINKHIKGKTILDIGTGAGGIYHHLLKLGYFVTGLDVHNVSAFRSITPIIYNGTHFPFSENQFDTGIIVHVLHHCKDGMKVLKEAMRTCKRVVLIEDTFRNSIEHKIVSFNDNLGNWEWYQHPYHPPDWWTKIFKKNGWKIIYREEFSEFTYKIHYGRYVLFVLEK